MSHAPIQQWAGHYIGNLGLAVVPLAARSKKCVVDDWMNRTFAVEHFAENANIGLRSINGLVVRQRHPVGHSRFAASGAAGSTGGSAQDRVPPPAWSAPDVPAGSMAGSRKPPSRRDGSRAGRRESREWRASSARSGGLRLARSASDSGNQSDDGAVPASAHALNSARTADAALTLIWIA